MTTTIKFRKVTAADSSSIKAELKAQGLAKFRIVCKGSAMYLYSCQDWFGTRMTDDEKEIVRDVLVMGG
jgi:hypothetical protein